ncbi:MAG: hypothetical protein QOE45_2960 [Frankiaceae bacterium]|jgi:hypothetical protein|nr:hypothetical protein [Frankiaceae bacterium]
MTTNRTNRAEDFERALSADAGAKVDPTMAALLAVAGALTALPQRPAPAFREALRTTLMAEASSLAASVPAVPAPRLPAARSVPKMLQHPAMQVATGGLAAAIAVTGLGVGASRSLPGDALYGLKRAVEGFQVGTSGGAVGEASSLVEHARTRLDEVRALIARGDLTGDALARVEAALRALESELRSAVDRLVAAARNGSRLAYDRLSAAVDDLTRQLMGLLGSLPDSARALAGQSLGTLNAAAAQLAALPRPSGPPVTPATGTPTPSDTGLHTGPPPTLPPSTTPPATPPVTTPPVTTPPPVTPPVSVPVTTPPPPTLPITLPPLLP